MQNNPHSQEQESQRGRTRLDAIEARALELLEATKYKNPRLNYLIAYDVRDLHALAVACRDARTLLDDLSGYWSFTEHEQTIQAILTALAPLLQPIEAPEGDEEEAGGAG